MTSAAQLTLVNVSARRWRYDVTSERQIIGRSSEAQIRIPDYFHEVSRRHAAIWFEKGDVWICDLGSLGGTSINGVWIKSLMPFRVMIGDRIVLNNTELHLGSAASATALVDTVIEMVLADETEQTSCHQAEVNGDQRSEFSSVTPAELKVLLWMRRGYVSDEEISGKTHRSIHTIRTQVASLMQKLRVNSRSEILGKLNRMATFDRAIGKRDSLSENFPARKEATH
jgi:DNA-binding CsgD family transcriptional regulator